MGVLPEGTLLVKRTFLEFVTSSRAECSRARHYTDTHLLEAASWAADVASPPSVRLAGAQASLAVAPVQRKTSVLDAHREPHLGFSETGTAASAEAALGMDACPGSKDNAPQPQCLVSLAPWPGNLHDQDLTHNRYHESIPAVELAQNLTSQGACSSSLATRSSLLATSLTSADVCTKACGTLTDSSEVWVGETRTTVLLRNVPTSLTRNMLLQTLHTSGFAGTFDMVYVPINFSTGEGLGYAFVNLVCPSVAPAFWRAFQGVSLWGLASDKVCSVSWSEPNQGLAVHIERYRNSPVMHPATPDEWKPALFSQGVRIKFPAPTKTIKAPKVRGKKAGFA
mmetsp:Transcript_123453/g.308506  ORF Transcript_123453/g.308506 Transcript_123453/m.308506 type:complete len:339 (-) Transcript_123453:452-1468(-)